MRADVLHLWNSTITGIAAEITANGAGTVTTIRSISRFFVIKLNLDPTEFIVKSSYCNFSHNFH